MLQKKKKVDALLVAKSVEKFWLILTVLIVLGMLFVLMQSIGVLGVLLPVCFLFSFVTWMESRDNVKEIEKIRSWRR